MKSLTKLLTGLKGLTDAVFRYPATAVFLLADAVLIAIQISTDTDYQKYIIACSVGAVLSIAFQALYERFFNHQRTRIMLMAAGALLAAGYYLIIMPAPELGTEIYVRTWVTVFALTIAFIWCPVIKSRVTFNESFMATFKAFFQSALYSAVLYAGISLIIAAIDRLIAPVDSDAYSHSANIVFVLFAPAFFLSKIPVYPGKNELNNVIESDPKAVASIEKSTHCPKFLEVLISYIIIPLTAIFTIILLIYIAINITNEFWTNNLLEPMLISYSITVLLVYILASGLENKFAKFFRLISPKILIPIVLFQIASSLLGLKDTGLTYSRYYVVLFGIYAAASGVMLSIVNVRKNGIIAAMAIAFAAVSIIPPVDAFTQSRLNQEHILKTELEQNQMLQNGAIIPNGSIPDASKLRITSAVEYLYHMEYAERNALLGPDFDMYEDFYAKFGFEQYLSADGWEPSKGIYLSLEANKPIEVSGYDFIIQTYIGKPEINEVTISTMQKNGKTYTLSMLTQGSDYKLMLKAEDGTELVSFDSKEIFNKYTGYTPETHELTMEEATLTAESNLAKLTIITQYVSISQTPEQTYYDANFYVLISIK